MIRRTVSLLTLISFVLLILSSLALYAVPFARDPSAGVTHFLGFSKLVWKNIHITGGFLFVIIAAWHTRLNGKALLAHIRKSRSLSFQRVFPAVAAIGITCFIYAGTVAGIEPMNSVVTWKKPPAAQSMRR